MTVHSLPRTVRAGIHARPGITPGTVRSKARRQARCAVGARRATVPRPA